MTRLIAIEYMSLDGVIQAPGHPAEDQDGGFEDGGWTGPFMDEHARYNTESFQAAGAFLLGRRTYEEFAAACPNMEEVESEFAVRMNSLPKYVASTTLNRADWQGTTILRDGLPTEIERLKRESGKPILMIGSSDLAQTLIEHNLLDEYQLWLHPVVLGGGKRLFRDGNPARRLRLIDSRTTRGGLMILTYGRAE
jgi:dihydrofolate reductase